MYYEISRDLIFILGQKANNFQSDKPEINKPNYVNWVKLGEVETETRQNIIE